MEEIFNQLSDAVEILKKSSADMDVRLARFDRRLQQIEQEVAKLPALGKPQAASKPAASERPPVDLVWPDDFMP